MEAEDSDGGGDIEVEGTPMKVKRKRGKGKDSGKKKGRSHMTVAGWIANFSEYSKKDVGKGVVMAWVGKKSGLVWGPNRTYAICEACSFNGGAVFKVDTSTKGHMRQHFGFGPLTTPAASHAAALDAYWKQPKIQLNVPIAAAGSKDEVAELQVDLACATALGGATAGQLVYFMDVLRKWCPIVASALPIDGATVLRNHLGTAAAMVEAAKSEERKGHQLHLSGDAMTDNRARSVYLTTAEFDGGKSQLLSIKFPKEALNNKSLGEMNSAIIESVGGSSLIDSYHHDAVSYGFKWGNEQLRDTYTKFLTDPCHRLDGVLEAMMDDCPAIQTLLSCGNNLFKKTNRSWVQRFVNYLAEKGYASIMYPSPGDTRSWTGDYRVLEWYFLYLGPLAEFVCADYPRSKDPGTHLAQLHTLVSSEGILEDTKIVIAWFLQYCADLVQPIMQLQSRTLPTVHLVFDIVVGLLDFMNHEQEPLKRELFKDKVLMGNADLLEAYKAAPDKSWVKDGIVNSILGGNAQLVKNWGVFRRKIGEASWELEITTDGDCFPRTQLAFYAVCSVIDPRKRTFQIPPVRTLLDEAIPWKFTKDEMDKIYSQMCQFLTDDSFHIAEDFDIRVFYSSLYSTHKVKYGAWCRFCIRCLRTPGGSAEVERAASAYNKVVTQDRTQLSDENIVHYVSIYVDGDSKRKERNTKRSNQNLVTQEKKRADREYELNDAAFWPKKLARAADEN